MSQHVFKSAKEEVENIQDQIDQLTVFDPPQPPAEREENPTAPTPFPCMNDSPNMVQAYWHCCWLRKKLASEGKTQVEIDYAVSEWLDDNPIKAD